MAVMGTDCPTHFDRGVQMTTQTKGKDKVVFFIDQQKFETEDRRYSVRELLEMAGETPEETTLVVRHGNDLEKLADLGREVEIKNGTHFVVFHNGPTPVS
jgi:hypothetical protein